VERKSACSSILISPDRGVRRIGSVLLACLFVLLTAPLSAQEDDPSEIFLKAYLSAQQGEKLEHENRFKTALAKFRFAGSLIEELRKSHSDWQPAIVEYRARKIGEGILRVQERISRHDELSAAARSLPDVVPSLPENEGWSEPGPEVVAPQGFDTISRGSSDGGIEEATRKLRGKIDQLQAALEKSRSDLETARRDKEAINTRLQETNSSLENAQKEIETSKESEHQARDQLAQTQASLKTLQAAQANSTPEQLRTQIADLKNEVAAAEQARATAERQRDETNAKLSEANGQIAAVEQQGQVTQLQQQLVDSQKQNQYLVARIAELWVQLDETGAKLASRNSEDTDRLLRENELLRKIIVRERQEETRRDEARKLMLAELDKLEIKSDALKKEIEFLAQPITKLSSDEFSLLRQPVVSASDQKRGALTASFIFAKQSAGDSVDSEAATNNSGELKGVVRDNRQTVAHAANENFSGASAEGQTLPSKNPRQGSE
jgi:hypothetical protein